MLQGNKNQTRSVAFARCLYLNTKARVLLLINYQRRRFRAFGI
jgi:hypothetical protein